MLNIHHGCVTKRIALYQHADNFFPLKSVSKPLET